MENIQLLRWNTITSSTQTYVKFVIKMFMNTYCRINIFKEILNTLDYE